MSASTPASPRQQAARWSGAVELLTQLRGHPGITRSQAAQRAGLSSGSATEICARLRQAHLLSEEPARPLGRGRPTTTLHPDAGGPLAAVVDVQHHQVSSALVDLAGQLHQRATHRLRQRSPQQVLAVVHQLLEGHQRRHGQRVQVVSLSLAATISRTRAVQSAALGWDDVDLATAVPHALAERPLLVTNDATAAALAEARSLPSTQGATVLSLTLAVGLGGALVVDGHPQAGAHGAGGELGHLPFGDPSQACPCGASGCWELEVDGRAMARHRGHPPPPDPHGYAEATLEAASSPTTDPGALQAVQRCARALARGTAGLVNAVDADQIILGGLAPALRQSAPQTFAQAFTAGLMRWRRTQPPPLLDAVHGESAPLLGAAEIALDHLLTQPHLSAWAALNTRPSR